MIELRRLRMMKNCEIELVEFEELKNFKRINISWGPLDIHNALYLRKYLEIDGLPEYVEVKVGKEYFVENNKVNYKVLREEITCELDELVLVDVGEEELLVKIYGYIKN